ncbi:MAG: tRNA lysidine(34) synthetase TilS [Pseudomonadota bacterium]
MDRGGAEWNPGPPPHAHVVLAASGGRDSLGAMLALSRWHAEGRFARLSVFHVDHGLHPDSSDWTRRTHAQAEVLGVPARSLRVAVERGRQGKGRGSLEAAAREARYRALDAALGDALAVDPDHPPVLVTAHHAGDQAETVLLALMRGSGGRGLSGMAAWRRRGRFFHWRPFLDWPRERLEALAVESGLPWVDDPSNDDPGMARNFLRHRVLPALRDYWPDAVARIGASSEYLVDEQRLLAELACEDAGTSLDRTALEIEPLTPLSFRRRLNVVRQWLSALGCLPPPAERLAEWLGQVTSAARDRQPRLDWPGGQLRRWGGKLWWLAIEPAPPDSVDWPPAAEEVDFGAGRLARRRPGAATPAVLGGRADPPIGWRVRPVSGRERLRDAAGAPSRELRKRFQEAGIPPWERAAAVGIEIDGRLAAVYVAGQWWVEADFCPAEAGVGWSLDVRRESD